MKLVVITLAAAISLAGILTDSVLADEAVGNQVFFRGGAAFLNSNRSGEVFTDAFGTTTAGLPGTRNGGDSGYYVGAGLDLVLSKDVWGMMSKTWALGEIGVEFKRFKSNTVAVAVPSTCAAIGIAGCSVRADQVQLTMLTVSVAPKIKFWEGSQLRPWIIPIGLDFHVISPPSNATTVLDIGGQFGAGIEYHLFRAFHLGLDGRYHLATGQTQTTNNFGTIGAYVALSF
jgi:hypothetical protein